MKIACLLGPGFEDSEFQKPYDEFKKAGHDVVIIGVEAGQELHGDKGKVTTKTDKAVTDVRPDEFDALLIPGGHSPDKIRINKDMVNFTRAMFEKNKPVFAICHGPQLILTADCYKDRTMTAWPTVLGDLEAAGVKTVDQEVCVDGNLVTSRKPDDIPAFVQQSLQLLGQSGSGAQQSSTVSR